MGLIAEQILLRHVKRFRGGLVFKAHRLVDHSTLGWRVIKNKKKPEGNVVLGGDAERFYSTLVSDLWFGV